MDIGKISKKLMNLGSDIKGVFEKKTPKIEAGQIQEFSSEASRSLRASFFPKIIFKYPNNADPSLKANLKAVLEYYKKMGDKDAALSKVKAIIGTINDDNLELANIFLSDTCFLDGKIAILRNAQNKDMASAMTSLFKSVYESPNFQNNFSNEGLLQPIFNLACWFKDPNDAEFLNMQKMVKLWMDNPEVSANYRMNSYFQDILFLREKPEDVESLISIIKEISTNPVLKANRDIQFHISDMLEQRSSGAIAAKKALIDKFLTDLDFQSKAEDNIGSLISSVNENNGDLIQLLVTDPSLSKSGDIRYNIFQILRNAKNKDNAQRMMSLLKRFSSDERFSNSEILQANIGTILAKLENEPNARAMSYIIKNTQKNPDINDEVFAKLLVGFSGQNFGFVRQLLGDSKLYLNPNIQQNLPKILNHISSNSDYEKVIVPVIQKCKDAGKFADDVLGVILSNVTQKNLPFVEKLLSDEELCKNPTVQTYLAQILKNISSEEDVDKVIVPIIKKYNKTKGFSKVNIGAILANASDKNLSVIDLFLSDYKLCKNESIQKSLGKILANASEDEGRESALVFIIEKYKDTVGFNSDGIGEILANLSPRNLAFAVEILENEKLSNSPFLQKNLSSLMRYVDFGEARADKLKEFFSITPEEELQKLTCDEIALFSNLIGVKGAKNVNEISLDKKRDFLRYLTSRNINIFDEAKKYKDKYPLLPASKEEYCSILNKLAKSIGIQTNPLDEKQIAVFNHTLFDIAGHLEKMSDSKFSSLTISQKYSRQEFIKDVQEKIKTLDKADQQKVFDYFGFELKPISGYKDFWTIVGYPMNLNNGQKLSEISNPEAKKVIEEVRKLVIQFNDDNQILVNDPVLQEYLNELISAIPEFRTTIGKAQHETHFYDVAQHSLKVMAKIAQNPEFKKLNDSDKKVMLIASLFHDITKFELKVSPMHAQEGAFDVFYLAKKFNLTQSEQNKLNQLIKYHEWLGDVNKTTKMDLRVKKMQSYAFDMQTENVFQMAKIFTEADLKAIKQDDSFYNMFSDDFRRISASIESDIGNLRVTQPILPITKMPKASVVSKNITQVNPDMSTNIKGLYKTPEGLIVIKFNEVEDWEALGFPKGSVSRGYKTKAETNNSVINTGNIKFIVHGLDHEDQLATFDTFALPDSDALLSVSYAERPESKYRFFRKQGVIVETDASCVYGGGDTDSGSGLKKTIDTFKQNYVFHGHRSSDRSYISELIKKALNMTDEQYVKFVQENRNKSMLEIEPPQVREKLIKAMAQINSAVRSGDRSYNEMYISNPEISGAFAYSDTGVVGNISEFISQQEDFLKKYAIEHDVPFVVFGD